MKLPSFPPPLSLFLLSSLASAREGETFHLAVIGMELSKVLNLFISIVCVCVYTIVYMSCTLCIPHVWSMCFVYMSVACYYLYITHLQ